MNNAEGRSWIVTGALLFGMLNFGFAPILVRVAGDTDPFALAAVRTVSAAAVLLVIWFFSSKAERHAYTRKENLLAFGAGAALGLHFICWTAAIMLTSVASASVLVTIHPVMLILIEAIYFERKFSRLVWFGVFMAFSGSVMLGISDAIMETEFEHALRGDFLAILAAVLFVIYFLLSQQLRQTSDWLGYITRVYGITALTCVIVAMAVGTDFSMSTVALAAGIGLGLGPQIAGHGAMNYAVKFISPAILATLILVEPVLGSFLAWGLFNEVPPGLSIPAIVIILCGVLMAWVKRSN